MSLIRSWFADLAQNPSIGIPIPLGFLAGKKKDRFRWRSRAIWIAGQSWFALQEMLGIQARKAFEKNR